jgi:class 3 adenylate cyclase/CHASE2 domain-containing sensor protein
MTAKRRAVLVFALAALVGAVLGAMALSRAGYRAETQILDRFFPLRFRLFGAQPIDPRLVIVGVDSATVDRFGKPVLFWQTDLANLVAKLKEGQPAVVGLDFLISPKTAGLADDDPIKLRLQDEALQLGLVALDGPPVVLVERFAKDEFSTGDGGKGYEADQVFSPHEVVRDLLLQPDGTIPAFGIANIATDPDGAVRRMKLFHWRHPQTQELTPSNFAFRLLEFATGKKLEFRPEANGRPESLTWNGLSVPFLFDESFLLNFPGPIEENAAPGQPAPATQTFPIISATSVLDGSTPASEFQGKIVIVAPTADTLDDSKVVPGDPTYHGGALHATVLNMLLTDGFISRGTAVWILAAALSALAGAALGRAGRIEMLLLTGLVVLPVGYFLAFALAAVWLPTFFSLLAFAAGSLLGYVERLFTVERDRARVRSTFARMVSPQVMLHVLRDVHNLRHGVRKEVTVLFTDINDFTPVCEKHEPEEVIEMLSHYFSLMVDVIMKYDGYLKQYVGDEIMVIFGAPDDRDDHATRAVLTVLEMRDVLAKAKREANGRPGFYEIKAGLNTGPVVVGRVGPEARWEYAAVGDNVNLGARVMSVAQKLGMDIGVSDATRQRYQLEREQKNLGEDPVIWTSAGVQTFKGKVSQMEVFAVERRPSASKTGPGDSPLSPASEQKKEPSS